MTLTTKTAYAADLAYIHHVGFSDFVRNATPGLLGLLRRHGIRDGLVVDVACGSGTWAAKLTSAGYDVRGIDLSPAMIALARKHAPAARFVTGSLWTTPLPKCSAVTCLGEGISYLFDRGRHTLPQLFRRIDEALMPGGVFIFDVAAPGRAGPTGHRRSWVSGQDWAILFENREDKRRPLLVRRMTTFRKIGDRYRRREEIHRVRLFHPQEVERELKDAGFEVRRLNGYGRQKFDSGLSGFFAKKH